MDWAAAQLNLASLQPSPAVQYLAVDGAWRQKKADTAAVDLGLAVLSKLRSDANLRYLYTGVINSGGVDPAYDGKAMVRLLDVD